MELLRTRLCEWRPVGIDVLAVAPNDCPEPRLAVGRSNGALELWDTTTWHLQRSAPGSNKRSIRGIAWVASEGGEGPAWRLLSAGLHSEVTEWDLLTLEPTVSVASGGGGVWAMCALGQRLFTVCEDGSVRVFSLEGGAGEIMYTRRFVVGKDRLLSVALVGDDTLFVGGSDSLLTKWAIKSGTCEAKLEMEKRKDGSETLVWALAGLGEHEVASGDSLGLVQIWDAVACTRLHRFVQHQADVLALAAAPGGGGVLLSGGVDAKVCTFYRQPDAEERWVIADGEFAHTHDVRALAVLEGAERCVSGGVTGKMHVSRLGDKSKSPIECSWFSPCFQTASIAQDSRVVLCQQDAHLELWYLQPPKEPLSKEVAPDGVPVSNPGQMDVAGGNLPEPQLLLRVALGGASEGHHLTASAITPDGRLFAASDASGTRLFRFSVADLEVRVEKDFPAEVKKMASGALLFCGAGMLAVAGLHSRDVIIVDTSRLAVVARFSKQHAAPVSHFAAAGEWLASADPGGLGSGKEATVHVFNVDNLQHHSRVPVGGGRGFPTAIGFDARGKRLVVVLSSHEVMLWDVEAQALVQNLTNAMTRIPKKLCPMQARISGIAAPSVQPDKVLFWGHNMLLSLDLQPDLEEEPQSKKRKKAKGQTQGSEAQINRDTKGAHWRRYPDILFILSLSALDESRWGNPVLKGHYLDTQSSITAEPEGAASKKRSAPASGSNAMVLTLEVAQEVAKKSLPQLFERKKFYANPAPREQ